MREPDDFEFCQMYDTMSEMYRSLRHDIRMTTLFHLRLMLKSKDKSEFTMEELEEFIDHIAELS